MIMFLVENCYIFTWKINFFQEWQNVAEMFHALRVDVLDAAGCRRARLGQHVDGEVREAGLSANAGLVGETVLEEFPALSCDWISA